MGPLAWLCNGQRHWLGTHLAATTWGTRSTKTCARALQAPPLPVCRPIPTGLVPLLVLRPSFRLWPPSGDTLVGLRGAAWMLRKWLSTSESLSPESRWARGTCHCGSVSAWGRGGASGETPPLTFRGSFTILWPKGLLQPPHQGLGVSQTRSDCG